MGDVVSTEKIVCDVYDEGTEVVLIIYENGYVDVKCPHHDKCKDCLYE